MAIAARRWAVPGLLALVAMGAVWQAGPAQAATITVRPDTASVSAGSFVDTDVRANDTTTAGPLHRPSVLTAPAHGTATVNAGGTIRYRPAAHFSGADSYRYRVCDSAATPDCGSAVVSVSVDNVFVDGAGRRVRVQHDVPATIALSSIVTTIGAPIDPTNVTATALPIRGTLAISRSTGAVRYAPNLRTSGIDAAQLLVCDTSRPGSQCHTVTLVFAVAANTVTAQDITLTTGVDIPTPPIDVVAATTTGSPRTPLDPASVSVPAPGATGGPQHGTVTIDPGSGKIVYTPASGFIGTDAFRYTICDTSIPTPVCDTKTITVRVTPISDVASAKSLDQPQLIAGAPFRYAVQVTDKGPADAPDVHSIDPVAADLLHPVGTPDPSVSGATCHTRATTAADLAALPSGGGPYSISATPLVVECVYPTIPSGATVRTVIAGTVAPDVVAGTSIANSTVAVSTNYDPDPANNAASIRSTVTTSADLVLTKTVDHVKVSAGDTVHFRVTVTNKGPSDAARFEVVDRPHRLTVRSVRVSGGAVSADGRSWSVPGLAAGHTIVLSMTATVNAVGARNVARIEHASTPDPDRADNGGANCRPGTVGCGLVELDVTALANTGEPIAGLLALTCGLLLTGVGTLLLTRSRRT